MNSAEPGSRPASDTGARPSDRDPALWRHPKPAGYAIGFMSFATIAAPLLVGFSLTAIITLSSNADNRGTRGDIAIAAFSVAAVLMLFTLQSGIAASQRAIPPDQRAAQYPEARHHLGWMRELLLDQWRDEKLAWRLYARCRWTYNLGIIAFLGGVTAVLIPSPGKWDLHPGPVFRMVALVVTVIAILIEIVLTFRKPGFMSRWLVPGSDALPVRSKRVKDDPDLIKEGEQDRNKLAKALVEAQLLAFGDNGKFSGDSSNVGAAATAFVAVTSALESLATRVAELNQAVGNSVNATIRLAETAEAQLAQARLDSEHRSLAAAAMRRANVEVTGPYKQETGIDFGQRSTSTERWKVLNRGPAVARAVRLELPSVTAEWLGQDVHLLDRKAGPPPEELELGDLQVGKARAVRVSKVGEEKYPVSIVLSWTDDDGLHKERRSIGYTQLPWL